MASGIGRRRTAAREEASASYRKRRREIAAAAVRVFNRLGLAGASLSAVAAELGIDRASLYYYIGSKEELFDEIVREVIERNSAIARGVLAAPMPPRDKLRAVIVALMDSYGEHYPLIYLYIRENLSHVGGKRSAWSKHMRKVNREIEDAVIAIVEQGCADGSFRNLGSPRVVAYGVLGVIGWTHRWFRPERAEVGAAEIGRIYADMVLSGLATPG